jgi:molecular chaperone HscB
MEPFDPFAVLELPVRFDLDSAALEKAYLEASRRTHPDFFAHDPVAYEQAQERSAALNAAYTTLKDPYRRAECLLNRLGGPSAQAVRDADPAFLAEVLEIREEIEETLAAGGPDGQAARTLAERLKSDRDARLREIGAGLAGADPTNAGELAMLRGQLNSVRYLDGLLRDLLG